MKLAALLLAGTTAVMAGFLGYKQLFAPTHDDMLPGAMLTASPQPVVLPDVPAPFSAGTDQGSGNKAVPTVPATPVQAAPPAAQTPAPAPAPIAAPAIETQAAPPAATPAKPKVDESALRYFARQGDRRRLEVEIARLRALYPGWTPPANPLQAAPTVDAQLDAMWALYAQGKLAEVRKAIAERQKAEPTWQVPDDLLQRLAIAEAREQLVNASNLKQFETVIRVGSANPSLLTCSEVDVLWRVAEAFARTDRETRATDAYRYVLTNCDNPGERLATMQKAMVVLPRPAMDALLATERSIDDGTPEFQTIRQELARRALAAGDADPKLTVAPTDITTVEQLADTEKKASDGLLLGWYYLRRDDIPAAEKWFRQSRDIEDSASGSQGLGLALIAQSKPAEAEDILFKWRDGSDEQRSTYLAAAANLLAADPPVEIPANVLQRIVPAVVTAKDAATAQQLGWYAYILNQFETAARWFEMALQWKPGDEPSAYGLAITAERLGDKATVAAIQRQWAGHSDRIAQLGETRQAREARARQQRQAAPVSPLGRPLSAPDAQPQFQPYQAQPQAPLDRPLAAPDAQPQFQPYQAQPQAPAQFDAQPLANTVEPAPLPPIEAAPRVIDLPRRQIEQEPTEAPWAPPALERVPVEAQAVDEAPAAPRPRAVARQSGGGGRGCATTLNPDLLSPQAAVNRGWCLMNLNRPIEAAAAFESALRGGSATVRRDAAYGQSLAYLRAGLGDQAAVAASKAPLEHKRSLELETSILEKRASGAFDAGRYVEALLALDQRDAIAPQRVDLMVLRGYAYMNLSRWGDAEQVFRAIAATGNKEGARGLANLKQARHPSTSGN